MNKMKYVFGPVPSRRLGQSLGIDTIPLKTCNWNCVYCQLGRTKPLVNTREEFFPAEEIVAEVANALDAHKPEDIDWVTFVGTGEPTLHTSTGWIIRQVKALTDLPVAVITNGALFYLPEVRQELMAADAVLPSLDAGNAKLYRKINRPHPDISFERLIDGLIAFQQAYEGKLWIEIMLIQGLNDTEEALEEIAGVLARINPEKVHLNLPTRPPAETWVHPPDEEGILRARAILGNEVQVVHPAEGVFDLSRSDNITDALVGIVGRHPMTQKELETTLIQWVPGQVRQALDDLAASGRIQILERYGTRFWSAAPSLYPNEAQSRRTKPGYPRQLEKGNSKKPKEG